MLPATGRSAGKLIVSDPGTRIGRPSAAGRNVAAGEVIFRLRTSAGSRHYILLSFLAADFLYKLRKITEGSGRAGPDSRAASWRSGYRTAAPARGVRSLIESHH